MRQFRPTDTSQWFERYGNGGDGDLTISADTTDAPIDSACTGTSGTNSLSATNASFAAGQIIKIIQTRGTGANSDPNWEWNVIESYSAGTITTKYPLDLTYNSGAQVVVFKQYRNVTLNAKLTAKAWNGTVGGELGFFHTGTLSGTSGTLYLVGCGFRGGNGSTHQNSSNPSFCGEGYAGAQVSGQATANGNGGGGTDGSGADGGPGGGGGSNATAGTAGGNGQGTGGATGSTAGNAALTSMVMPGAGGGGRGEKNGNSDGGNGATAPGNLTIVGRNQDFGSITVSLSGSNGANASPSVITDGAGGGGASAGGNGFFIAQTLTGAGSWTATGGTGGAKSDTPAGNGGNGGNGRFAVYYGISVSGTSNPTATTLQDSMYLDIPSGYTFMSY